MRSYWLESGQSVDAQRLAEEAIVYLAMPLEAMEYRQPLERLKAERGYLAEDEVVLAPDTPGLVALLEKFRREHSHSEDEVRFVLAGAGVFDIRARNDAYIRIEVGPGDLLVVPEKRNHRFMLTEDRAIRCVRLFKDQSGWAPSYRTD